MTILRAVRTRQKSAAPFFTTAPVLVGTPTSGVACLYTPGTVGGVPIPTVTQQWTLDGVDIGGANGATYTPLVGDIGHLLRVRQIATNGVGSPATSTSVAGTVSSTGVAPAFTSTPSIVGTPKVGVASSYTPGTVTGFPVPTVTRQWTLDGTDIVGATGATYTPVTGNDGHLLRVRETASNGVGAPVSSTSASKSVNPVDSAPAFTSGPVIVGTPAVGVATSYTPGTVTGFPAPTIFQQWTLDGVDITGATNPTYVPTGGDSGHALRVRETANNGVGSPAANTSSPVDVASSNIAPSFTSAPVIVGIPQVGVATSYTPGTVTGSPSPTVTRQWSLDGVDIAGATNATYTPVTGDATHFLRIRETASNGIGSPASSTSAPTTVTAVGSDNWAARITGSIAADRMDHLLQLTADGNVVGAFRLNDGGPFVGISFDPTTKHQASSGSTKIQVNNTNVASDGDIGLNFANVTTIQDGQTVWCSYSFKPTKAWLRQAWPTGQYEPQAKLAITSHHTSTNQANEVVQVVPNNGGGLGGYAQDGQSFPGYDMPAVTACSNADFRWQDQVDHTQQNQSGWGIAYPLTGNDPETGQPWSACAQDRARYGGLYSAKSFGQFQRGLGDPISGEFRPNTDEWTSILVRIDRGAGGTFSSRYRVWAERENIAGWIPVLDTQHASGGQIRLGSGPAYDTLWMLPYVTNRVAGGTHATNQPFNIPGVTIVATGNGCPMGAGSLEYNAATKLFRWAGNGETFGAPRGFSAANGILSINVSSSKVETSGTIVGASAAGTLVTANTSQPHNLVTGQSVCTTFDTHPYDDPFQGNVPITVTGPSQFQYTAYGTPTSPSLGGGSWVCLSSHVVLEINPAALPQAGVVTDAITIASGRPNTQINYADLIVSRNPILSPLGALPPSLTVLETLANGLTAGSWSQLVVPGQDAALADDGGSGSPTYYTNQMPWNSLLQAIDMVISDHHPVTGKYRHIRYMMATNSFVEPQQWPVIPGIGHGYDHTNVNPFNGDLYVRPYGNETIYKKAFGAATFSPIPAFNDFGFNQVSIGTCWWSGAFNAGGGAVAGAQGCLMVFNCGFANGLSTDGQLTAYDPLTNSWFWNVTGKAPFYGSGSTYNAVMAYSAKKNVAVYGGGNPAPQKVWRLNADGTHTVLTDVPSAVSLGIDSAMFVEESVTGNFLLFSNHQLWELNPDGVGSWRRMPDPPSAVGTQVVGTSGGSLGALAVSIPDLGVTAVINQPNTTGGNFWVYKHAQPAGQTQLAQTASAMASGTWATLNTNNMVTSPISDVGGNWLMAAQVQGGIGADSNNMAWDPVHQRVHMVGQNHGNDVGMRHIYYDAPTNSWTTVGHFGTLFGDTAGHGLNSICCDPNTGDVYFSRYNKQPLAKFTHATQSWNGNFSNLGTGMINIGAGVVFWSGAFPGITGGHGAVMILDPDAGDLWTLDVGTGTVALSQALFPNQAPGYDNVAAYNRASNSGMFGGGENPSLIPMKLSSSKTVTILPQLPSPNALSIRSGTLCEHPSKGGSFLSITLAGRLYEYTDSGAYNDLGPLPAGVNRAPDGTNGDNYVTVCALPEYGVMMVVSTTPSTAGCFLYKP